MLSLKKTQQSEAPARQAGKGTIGPDVQSTQPRFLPCYAYEAGGVTGIEHQIPGSPYTTSSKLLWLVAPSADEASSCRGAACTPLAGSSIS